MKRLIAIGDIHGCANKLKTLLDTIGPQKGDKIVFIGDYIDRGPSTKEVINTILELKKQGIELICLMGNHERLLLKYANSPDDSLLPYLRQHGIEATVKSYGHNDLSGVRGLLFMPREHREFLMELKIWHQEKGFFFTHAGINPDRTLSAQRIEDMLEIRMLFIKSPLNIGKTIVFGHTPFDMPLVMPDKIGIDTGAVYGNMLTAVLLPDLIFYHA